MRRQSGVGALLAMVLNIRAKQIGELLLQGTLLGGLLRHLHTACTLICMPLLLQAAALTLVWSGSADHHLSAALHRVSADL